MTEVISIKFKSCGKNYYFSPEGMEIQAGQKVIVETAKGLEMAECSRGNRWVEDTAVIQPLRPVVRIATAQDLKTIEQNKEKEKDAFDICQKKIAEHKLDMKLVSVEWSFDGSKTLFFFTSDGRVDFRELVKDLASIFHNRIELRQIGVRDEAKMIGGLGICGRPFCCSEFLDDFAPVSTKMAKVQNLSLNPAKISGCCGRLMCCLRYEEEAYESLYKNVPKQGAFVETVDGYGVVEHVGLLRQTVKVHLDGEADDSIHVYKAKEVAAVPGGRPKDGEPYPKVLHYNPDEEEDEVIVEEDPWATPTLFAEPAPTDEPALIPEDSMPEPASNDSRQEERRRNRRRSGRGNRGEANANGRPDTPEESPKPSPAAPKRENRPAKKDASSKAEKQEKAVPETSSVEKGDRPEKNEKGEKRSNNRRRRPHNKPKPAASEGNTSAPAEAGSPKPNNRPQKQKPPRKEPPKQKEVPSAKTESASAPGDGAPKKKNNRRRYYGHKPKSGGNSGSGAAKS